MVSLWVKKKEWTKGSSLAIFIFFSGYVLFLLFLFPYCGSNRILSIAPTISLFPLAFFIFMLMTASFTPHTNIYHQQNLLCEFTGPNGGEVEGRWEGGGGGGGERQDQRTVCQAAAKTAQPETRSLRPPSGEGIHTVQTAKLETHSLRPRAR